VKGLIVDGDAARRQVVRDLLRVGGHEVREVADGAEALARHHADPFDLIVLDGDAPAPGGLDLCRRVRALPGGSESVVLALIGSVESEPIRLALDSGAIIYASASLDPRQLATRLQIAARQASAASEHARLYAEAQRASARLRALAWAATEAQGAPDEAGVFDVIDAAIVRSGLNVHASLLPHDPEGGARLIVRHVALVDDMLPFVERLLGRPIVGMELDAERVAVFRSAVRERRVVPVPDAAEWLRETLPWMSRRAARVIGRLREVGQGTAVPITDGREVLGVLSVWGESLGEPDMAAIELLGRQAGAALAALRHRAAERERDRLDGAMLLARTAAHAINNALGLTSGYAELLAGHPAVASDPELSGYVAEILKGTAQAAERVGRFQRVTRLEETPSPLGEGRPLLDLDRSVAPSVG
jgi:CheY-like chemotaxis protein